MNYKETQNYIQILNGFGSRPGLDTMKELLRRLNQPQKNLRCIHIAGTNGKGSVSEYLTSVLCHAGYRVGSYNSPTILDYRERIRYQDKMISKQALAKNMTIIKEACDDMVHDGFLHPTSFEAETALAFLFFQEKKSDFVVLEAGMGGTADATNVLEHPDICVLTPIGMDHMQFLGDSIDKITLQKCGIFRENCTVVSALQTKEAEKVIKEQAKKHHCKLILQGVDEIKHVKYGLQKQTFDTALHERVEITMAGCYQPMNALTALKVIDVLVEEEKGKRKLTEYAIREGLKEASLPGRFQVIGKKPYIIADGAHNEGAAVKLAESVRFYFTNRKIVYIMGVFKDKEYDKVISLTASYAEQIITITPPNQERALNAFDLALTAKKYHDSVSAADSLAEALEVAKLMAGKDGVIVCFGSLSFQGDLIRLVLDESK